MITTGRQLTNFGFPDDIDTAIIMLDGNCSFRTLEQERYYIWWGAYLGMEQELLIEGKLNEMSTLRASLKLFTSEERHTALNLLDKFGMIQTALQRAETLSGGQQQRVAAARAMATKPEVIFADEPSGNLDSKSSKELLSFMKSVVEELNQTIIMVTHDPYAASYANRVIMLKDGRIASDLDQPTQEEIVAEVTTLTNI